MMLVGKKLKKNRQGQSYRGVKTLMLSPGMPEILKTNAKPFFFVAGNEGRR